jgi:NADPH2:quinone reductase
MKAIEVVGGGRLQLVEVAEPKRSAGDVIVKVAATSVNRGEIYRARASKPGFRPGWDFAGVVHEAADRGGPVVGTRVVGFLTSAAWAETIAVPKAHLTALPDSISFADAATIPVAGLTALGAVEAGGSLLGRSVLVTGATGGVGHFAVQLAALAGAQVTALVRRPAAEVAEMLAMAKHIVGGPDAIAQAEKLGPFDHIVETLGGETLSRALGMLSYSGKCMVIGVTDTPNTTFDAEKFFMTGNAAMQAYVLFRKNSVETHGEALARVLLLAADGALPLHVGYDRPWTEIDQVADDLLSRSFLGKAILRVG